MLCTYVFVCIILSGDYLLVGNGAFVSTVDLDGTHTSMERPYDTAAVVAVDFDYR